MADKNNNIVYIYALVDPRDKSVRYIGQSINPKMRFVQHLKDDINVHKKMWFDDLNNNGLRPEMIVIDVVERNRADATEKRIIRDGIKAGWLLTNIMHGNMTITIDGETNWCRLIKKYISQDNYNKFKKLNKEDQFNICQKTAVALLECSNGVMEMRGLTIGNTPFGNASICASKLIERF